MESKLGTPKRCGKGLFFSPTEVSFQTTVGSEDEATIEEMEDSGLNEAITNNFYTTPGQQQPHNDAAALLQRNRTVSVATSVKSNEDSFGGIAGGRRYSTVGESKTAKQALISALSALYAMLLIIMSLGFEVSTIVVESVRAHNYDFFYIYLYSVALLFLGYCYAFLLKSEGRPSSRRLRWFRRSRSDDARNELANQGVHLPDEILNLRAKMPMSVKHITTHSARGAGSLYLRLGCVVFGVVGLISKGLHLFSAFDSNEIACIQASTIAETALSCIFIFIQMFFIFENSKLVIHRFRSIAGIGFMHLIATNLCMWIRNLVEEQFAIMTGYNERQVGHPSNASQVISTVASIIAHQQNQTADNLDDVVDPTVVTHAHTACPSSIGYAHHRHEVGALLADAKPFMTTCIIEYSLICSATTYILWRHIGHSPKLRVRRRKQRFHVDCSSSTKGLFVGLLFMVFTIITMLIFFTKLRSGKDHEALWVFYASDAFLYTVSLAAIAIAGARLRKLYYAPGQHEIVLLDDILLIVGLLGQLVFCVFSVVPLHSGSLIAALLVVTSVLRIIEVLLQTLFIFFGQRLATMNSVTLGERKPGRELVTFLLLTNLSMFLINTFETQKAGANPLMHEFYGKGIWTVIVHSTTPLCIFYRFHSTVCLAEIWKHAYRVKET